MTRCWRLALSFGSLLCASLLSAPAAASPDAEEVRREIAAQTLITVASDYETSGGGLGLGLAAGAALPWSALAPGAYGVVRLRANILEGFGLVGTTELDVGLRFRFTRHWQPEMGLSGWYAFGALVRTIDTQGRLANNPWAILLALDAVRFELGESWVSVAGLRAGPTLFRSGNPPLVVSLTLLQVGRHF